MPKKITPEQAEPQFWTEVDQQAKALIANLIEKTLPISVTPSVFDCEKDADYRTLLRSDLPIYYAQQEEYQDKIVDQTWTKEDVEYVAQDLVCAYFDLVVQAWAERLSKYPTFANTNLAQTFMN
jgi:hypothetical protein